MVIFIFDGGVAMPQDRTARAERWRTLLESQRESGLSVAEFCRREEIGQHRVYYWRRRFRGVPGGRLGRQPAAWAAGVNTIA